MFVQIKENRAKFYSFTYVFASFDIYVFRPTRPTLLSNKLKIDLVLLQRYSSVQPQVIQKFRRCCQSYQRIKTIIISSKGTGNATNFKLFLFVSHYWCHLLGPERATTAAAKSSRKTFTRSVYLFMNRVRKIFRHQRHSAATTYYVVGFKCSYSTRDTEAALAAMRVLLLLQDGVVRTIWPRPVALSEEESPCRAIHGSSVS